MTYVGIIYSLTQATKEGDQLAGMVHGGCDYLCKRARIYMSMATPMQIGIRLFHKSFLHEIFIFAYLQSFLPRKFPAIQYVPSVFHSSFSQSLLCTCTHDCNRHRDLRTPLLSCSLPVSCSWLSSVSISGCSLIWRLLWHLVGRTPFLSSHWFLGHMHSV